MSKRILDAVQVTSLRVITHFLSPKILNFFPPTFRIFHIFGIWAFFILSLLLHWTFCNIGRFLIERLVIGVLQLGVLLHWAFCCIGRFFDKAFCFWPFWYWAFCFWAFCYLAFWSLLRSTGPTVRQPEPIT